MVAALRALLALVVVLCWGVAQAATSPGSCGVFAESNLQGPKGATPLAACQAYAAANPQLGYDLVTLQVSSAVMVRCAFYSSALNTFATGQLLDCSAAMTPAAYQQYRLETGDTATAGDGTSPPSVSLAPFDMTTEGGGLVAGAILLLWGLAFGIRMVIRAVRVDERATGSEFD